MKKILTFFCFLFSLSGYAQNPIPNPGFESWTGNDPLFWMSTNNDPYFTVTPSAQSYTGDSAARGEVISLGPVGQLAPLLYSGTGGQGFPVTQYYTELTFWYMSNMLSNDELEVDVLFFDSTSTIIGAGSQAFLGSAATYTKGTVPIIAGPGTPSTCIVTFSILNSISGTPNLGSWFIADDVDLSNGPSGMHDPAAVNNLSVYPVPANDYLYVNSTGSAQLKNTEIKMYDMTGRLVYRHLLNDTGQARFDISSLASGTYMLEAVSSGFSQRCKVLKN